TTGSRSRRRSTVDREADDKWNPKQEDDVLPSWPSPCISITTKDDSGGLEVILDVYFPPHVASL
ncbi:hypothetical protein U9M48_027834, partial [Paspalum notatum var. saurae]